MNGRTLPWRETGQQYLEPSAGALMLDPASRLLFLQSYKWGGAYLAER